jgi:hypothetical protein
MWRVVIGGYSVILDLSGMMLGYSTTDDREVAQPEQLDLISGRDYRRQREAKRLLGL